jgi:predicted transcriptional regulator
MPKAKSKAADAPEAPAKPVTKQQTIIELLKREGGATVAEIMAATNWKPHTVRAHLSIMRKRKQIPIEAALRSSGERCYSLPLDEAA